MVRHAIVRVLEPIFEKRFIGDSFACRKGRGTHAALRRCAQFAQRYRFALKCDVSRYFPSIDHEILTGLLRRAAADERLLALIGEVLASHRDGAAQEWPGGDLFAVKVRPRGLPIGNAIPVADQAVPLTDELAIEVEVVIRPRSDSGVIKSGA